MLQTPRPITGRAAKEKSSTSQPMATQSSTVEKGRTTGSRALQSLQPTNPLFSSAAPRVLRPIRTLTLTTAMPVSIAHKTHSATSTKAVATAIRVLRRRALRQRRSRSRHEDLGRAESKVALPRVLQETHAWVAGQRGATPQWHAVFMPAVSMLLCIPPLPNLPFSICTGAAGRALFSSKAPLRKLKAELSETGFMLREGFVNLSTTVGN